jgi:hypothetical protein
MRYRVHFVVRFEREIEASDEDTARRIADEIAGSTETGTCHWNTMQRLETGDDD